MVERAAQEHTAEVLIAPLGRAHAAEVQAALASFGHLALTDPRLALVRDDALALVARALEVEIAAMLELRTTTGELVLCAAKCPSGPHALPLGRAVERVGGATLGARALADGAVAVADFAAAPELAPAPPFAALGAVSGAAVAVPGATGALGVLAALAQWQRSFGDDELQFLQTVARMLGAAIERARAENAMRASHEELARVVDASADGLVLLDGACNVTRANRAAERLFGAAPGALVGRVYGAPPCALCAEDGLPIVLAALPCRRALATGEAQLDQELVAVRPDGVRATVCESTTPLRDADGAVSGAVVALMNITARKRAEKSLRLLVEAGETLSESLELGATFEAVARLAVHGLADWCAVMSLAEDRTVRGVATAHADPLRSGDVAALLRDYPLQRPGGQGVLGVLRGDAPVLVPVVSPAMLAAVAVDDAHLAQLRALGVRSYLIVPMVARRRRLGAIACVSATRTFTTEDLSLAQDLARRAALAMDNAALYQRECAAVAERDELLSVASHEIRSPLAALGLHIQGLQRSARGEPRFERGLAAARRQVDRLADMLDKLLDLSRVRAGRLALELTEVNLGALAREVVERLAPEAAAAGCPLQCACEAPFVGRWDRLRIEQVVSNLVGNALKYARGTAVRVTVRRDGDFAELRVRDGGPGIAAELLPRVFDRFERGAAQRAKSGLGLGLYISRQIMEAHGGSIAVVNAPDGGAEFIARMPLASG